MTEQIHHQYTWAQHVVWWLCSQFGAVTVLLLAATGITVWAIILFRKAIQDKFGDFLAWADQYVNRKQ